MLQETFAVNCAYNVNAASTGCNGQTRTLMADLAYRPYGRAKKMNNGAGDLVEAAHDLCGRLTVANPATPREQRFTYDANGNRLTKTVGGMVETYNHL